MGVTIYFDMGLSTHSSGNRYDPISSYTLMIRCLSKHIIAGVVSSKIYILCSRAQQNGEELMRERPPQTLWGLFQEMEVGAALHLYKSVYTLFEKQLTLRAIVVDDDSTTRALLRHESNNKKGRLPSNIPQPEWLVKPSHRTKDVAK